MVEFGYPLPLKFYVTGRLSPTPPHYYGFFDFDCAGAPLYRLRRDLSYSTQHNGWAKFLVGGTPAWRPLRTPTQPGPYATSSTNSFLSRQFGRLLCHVHQRLFYMLSLSR